MQAAERIFDGAFDHIINEMEDTDMASTGDRVGSITGTRIAVSTHPTTRSMFGS
jgi:hypothetical protein